MKQRVLVLNGQRIVQLASELGVWRNEKVERAGDIPPGIYNVDSAAAADKGQTTRHFGPVIQVDGDHVYQQVGKALIKHDAAGFDKLPVVGRLVNIQYDAHEKATVTAAVASLARGRTR